MTDVVNVEVCQKPTSLEDKESLKSHCEKHLVTYLPQICSRGVPVPGTHFPDDYLRAHVLHVQVDSTEEILQSCPLRYHVYQLYHEEPGSEEIEQSGENITTAVHWLLPSAQFQGLWDNLIFDQDIKGNLLSYAKTTLLFSDAGVDPNVITWNKVVLLHGPPGTGKTSLCKALAQKLSIHLSDRYTYGQLLEINSHSLFSKWFSESGKLVQKMFDKIQELIDDPQALVFVLIDEVESLTAARQTMSGSEPSDAVRVVNALLTQLDVIKQYPNVLILTTSNVSGNVDLAFVDRADIKQYIGPPGPAAIYTILLSCLTELCRVALINGSTDDMMKYRAVSALQTTNVTTTSSSSNSLYHIASKCGGLSGRTLRKLPFLAHSIAHFKAAPSMPDFMIALNNAVDKQLLDRDHLDKNHLHKQTGS
ncbi:pachytene checkpoint protein 2 homolog [Bolinopsis microptera]|uniref:pachytene checkpoint protein 2 homolog n=1 Tax=Bolinopsis microptera TaxID=2820187 RepID=UPI003079AE98